ncbi:Nn.00g017920.m01.CDS01 [Neocucurbitaria sp. VM-36]
MTESQSQSTNKGQAATSNSQPQQQSAPAAESQSQSATEGQAATSEPHAQRESVSVWAIGGQLEVDVGDGERVPVPNTAGRPPTREEIYQALVAAGHQERADELADRAYGNVSGTR